MLKPINNLKEVIEQIVERKLSQIKSLNLYTVTGVNNNLTVNIKELNLSKSYDNVEVLGQGLGNSKGMISLPSVGDIVVVGFISNSEFPLILGSVFDSFTSTPDNKPAINDDEVFINGKTNGSFIYIDDEGNIRMRTVSNTELKIENNGDLLYYNGTSWVQLTGGGASGEIVHNDTSGLQGGTTDEYYHLTETHHTDLTDGGNSILHYHNEDRNRVNHTGTQDWATITGFPDSDFVHTTGNEGISGDKTFNDTIISNKIKLDGTELEVYANDGVTKIAAIDQNGNLLIKGRVLKL